MKTASRNGARGTRTTDDEGHQVRLLKSRNRILEFIDDHLSEVDDASFDQRLRRLIERPTHDARARDYLSGFASGYLLATLELDRLAEAHGYTLTEGPAGQTRGRP